MSSNLITTYNPDTGEITGNVTCSDRQIRLGAYEHYIEGHHDRNKYKIINKELVEIDADIIEQSIKSQKFAEIRCMRNQLLVASDFSQLPDLPDDKKTAWAEYRQKLRDITKDVTDPNTITFPDPPA